jgi:hypothetical protein
MNKTYLVEELFEDIPGDADNVIFKIPPEICESQGWGEGDTISFKVENGVMIMNKIAGQENTEVDDYDKFVARLEAAYPLMFNQPYGGIAVGKGWWPIIESLCANIQSHINHRNSQRERLLKENPYGHTIPDAVPQVVVAQIKEKFGGLRFYYQGGDEQIHGMIRMAEAWAAYACEECGAPGTIRHGGWIKTLCDTHHNLRESRKQTGV